MSEILETAEAARGELRARIKAAQQQAGLSNKQVSTQAGLAYSTFSACMLGTYKGSYEQFDDLMPAWLEGRKSRERIILARPKYPDFIMTPTARRIMALLESAQYEPEMSLVAGGAGLGKTMAAEAYAAQNPNVWILTADKSMQSSAATLNELAETIGATERGMRRIRAITRRLKGTEGLIIVDEAQFLGNAAIEQLRSVFDQTGIGLVFMGNAPLNNKFDGLKRNADFAQLFSRLDGRLNLRKSTKRDVEMLLSGWEGFPEALHGMAAAIAANDGALRSMNKVIKRSIMLARGDERTTVLEKDLRAAWAQHMTGEFPKGAAA